MAVSPISGRFLPLWASLSFPQGNQGRESLPGLAGAGNAHGVQPRSAQTAVSQPGLRGWGKGAHGATSQNGDVE
jgi:hypothetical protein